MDVLIVQQHFDALKPETRDILLAEYLEETAAGVVGPDKVYAFFRYCFRGQSYVLTHKDEPYHAVWATLTNEKRHFG